MVYGLHEGFDWWWTKAWSRCGRVTRRQAITFRLGLLERGFGLLASEQLRLSHLTSAVLPSGVDAANVKGRLLADRRIEVGGGLGPLAGKIWRLGMMGYGATVEAADRLLAAIDASR